MSLKHNFKAQCCCKSLALFCGLVSHYHIWPSIYCSNNVKTLLTTVPERLLKNYDKSMPTIPIQLTFD